MAGDVPPGCGRRFPNDRNSEVVSLMTYLLPLCVLLSLVLSVPAGAQSTVSVYAAGSLRGAMTALATEYEKKYGIPVKTTFGPSGVLRERIEKGERPDMLASADMASPEALAIGGLSRPTVLFVRNRLCATGRAQLHLTPETVLGRLLDPAVRLGTSTPGSDPAGDYAWMLFDRAEAVTPGSAKALRAKADKIVGGPNNSAPVNGKHPVAAAFEAGSIDVFLGYCSGDLHKSVAGVATTQLPPELAVAAAYGLAVLKDAGPDAMLFALYLLSTEGQKIFQDAGFVPVGQP
ncbi:MAG: extracellular solute-binding protein [Solidesulfovibrio sp.]